MKKALATAIAVVLAGSAVADPKYKFHPCYGPKEEKLARALLDGVPLLKLSSLDRERAAKQVRHRTCLQITTTGRVVDREYARDYFQDARNRAIKMIAEKRNLDPLQLQAAIIDAVFPNEGI